MKRFITIEIGAAEPTPVVHTCTVCGKQDEWSGSWVWYGSYVDTPLAVVAEMCSPSCREAWTETNRLRVVADQNAPARRRT